MVARAPHHDGEGGGDEETGRFAREGPQRRGGGEDGGAGQQPEQVGGQPAAHHQVPDEGPRRHPAHGRQLQGIPKVHPADAADPRRAAQQRHQPEREREGVRGLLRGARGHVPVHQEPQGGRRGGEKGRPRPAAGHVEELEGAAGGLRVPQARSRGVAARPQAGFLRLDLFHVT